MSIVVLEVRHVHKYLSIDPVQFPSLITSPGLTIIPLIADISRVSRSSDVDVNLRVCYIKHDNHLTCI